MEVYFSKTNIGYSHVKEGKACQDFSDCYHDENCTIITACDGHGGEMYVRSDRGARFASLAAIEVLKRHLIIKIPKSFDPKKNDKIKLEILCEWNRLVEQDYAKNPFTKEELSVLSVDQRFELKENYVIAYGCTLNAVCITEDTMCCVNIGDGGIFILNGKDEVATLFEDDENVANVTHSLCSDNAYKHMNVDYIVCLDGMIKGVAVCTDGVVNPYASYENFYSSFAKPMFKELSEGNIEALKDFITRLGEEKGIGDDVSLAAYYRG